MHLLVKGLRLPCVYQTANPVPTHSAPREEDRQNFYLQPNGDRSLFTDGKQPARCRPPTSSAASVALHQTELLHPLSETEPSPDPLLYRAVGCPQPTLAWKCCPALLPLHPHRGICKVGSGSTWQGEKFTRYQPALGFSLTKRLKKMLKGSLFARRKTPES